MIISDTFSKKIGIYCIKNTTTNKCYVGSSKSIRTRLQVHRSYLRKNIHFNQHLQNAYNRYKELSFICFILEECNENNLATREQHWINLIGDYNNIKDVIRNKFSEESKRKLSITRTNRIASGEIKKNCQKAVKKYSIFGEFIEEYVSITEASIKNNIHHSTIKRAMSGIFSTGGGFIWRESIDNSLILPYIKKQHDCSKNNHNILILDLYSGFCLEFESYKECAKYFDINPVNISVIINRKNNVYKQRYFLLDLKKQGELLENPTRNEGQSAAKLN